MPSGARTFPAHGVAEQRPLDAPHDRWPTDAPLAARLAPEALEWLGGDDRWRKRRGRFTAKPRRTASGRGRATSSAWVHSAPCPACACPRTAFASDWRKRGDCARDTATRDTACRSQGCRSRRRRTCRRPRRASWPNAPAVVLTASILLRDAPGPIVEGYGAARLRSGALARARWRNWIPKRSSHGSPAASNVRISVVRSRAKRSRDLTAC